MSENSSKIASKLTKVENKLRRLQESYNALIKNYDTLKKEYLKLAACHTCIVENSEEIETQKDEINLNELDVEMIPLDVDQNSKDPIEFLPEHCAVKILKNLTGKELMKAMEVSKLWRDFINVQGVLMDKIILKPTNESCDFLINGTNDETNLRRYKYYEGPLYIHLKACPIEICASSLEVAVIELNSDRCDYSCDYDDHTCCDAGICPHSRMTMITQNFAKLQKLTFPVNRAVESLTMLKAAKFPMLTYLNLTTLSEVDIEFPLGEFKRFLCLFPKLQTLVLGLGYEAFNTKDDTIVNSVPKFKEFSYITHCPELLEELHSSLERYEVQDIDRTDLRDVLRDFKRLKSLSIARVIHFGDSKLKFEVNKSIEALYIGEFYERERVRNDSEHHVKDLLVALPSVKKLFYWKLNAVILKFIANNMLNLKQLGCRGIDSELREAYEDICSHPDNYLNSDFELIDTMPWDKMQNKYYYDRF